ncbi:DUF4862 family protein [Sanguibacter sp. 25GB23B1]|uniref:DUF4862 family protein n=1 Tax=unclassified Sanguibacter TaxID=2645534 RepID=UPI0032AFFA9E
MTTTSTAATPRATLGAYALSPSPDEDAGRAEAAFYEGLAELTTAGGHRIDALELPLLPTGSPRIELPWITRHVQPRWDLVVTCIPRVMTHLATLPAYGLASTDDDARRRAVADVAAVRDLAHSLADASGRPRITAIEVHTAPGPDLGSLDALARSFEEILAWDLAGAQVLVEHCDAAVPGQAAAKGFFTLDDELAIVRDLPRSVGIGINWGRSAIEGRSATTPVEHTRAAADAGRLRAVIFSGASDVETPWGAPWRDAHIPAHSPDPALAASSGSLLTQATTSATLAAAGEHPHQDQPLYVGAKVSAPRSGADVRTRLAIARASLGLALDAPAVR